ncbi:MAG: hypothetical protein WC150_03250 [Bacteroidia bacterium]
MKSLNIEVANRIKENRSPFLDEGVYIDNLLPSTFKSYCKILYPFEANEHTKQDLSIQNNLKVGDTISWEFLAKILGLTFHRDISFITFYEKLKRSDKLTSIDFPGEGRIPFELLLDILSAITKQDEKIFVYQAYPNNIMKFPGLEALFEMERNKALSLFQNGYLGYMYNRNFNWILFCDTDLPYSLFAGDDDAVNKLLLFGKLEIVKCEKSTRIDYGSDTINKIK